MGVTPRGLDEIEFPRRAGAVHGQLHVESVNELSHGRSNTAGHRTDQDRPSLATGVTARATEHAERRSCSLSGSAAISDWIVVPASKLDELRRGQDDVCCICTERAHAGYEIALAEVLDVCADGVDVAGEIVARAEAGLLDALVWIAACSLDVIGAGDTCDQDS